MPGMRSKESSQDKDMTKIEDIKKEYLQAAKKHKLPDFDKLDEMFEVRAANLENGRLLNSVIRLIINTMNGHVDNLYAVVNPSQNSVYSMLLSGKLNDKDKDAINKLYYEMVALQLDAVQALLCDDNTKASYIEKIYKSYPMFRKEMILWIKKFSVAWQDIIKEYNNNEKKRGFLS